MCQEKKRIQCRVKKSCYTLLHEAATDTEEIYLQI